MEITRKPGRPRGTPNKRTPARMKAICALLATGLSFSGAASKCGINQQTLHEWRRTDQNFAAQVDQAIADSESELMELAKAGARKDGRIALQMLSIRHPAEWAKREQVAHLHAHTTMLPAEFLSRLTEQRQLTDATDVEVIPS
jgi:transposase-like protein